MSSHDPVAQADEGDNLQRELEASMQQGYERWARMGMKPLRKQEPWMLTDEVDSDARWEQYYREWEEREARQLWRRVIRFFFPSFPAHRQPRRR